MPTVRICFHSSDFKQSSQEKSWAAHSQAPQKDWNWSSYIVFPWALKSTSIECFCIPWVRPSPDHIYRLWQQQLEVHFLLCLRSTTLLLTTPKSFWLWWIIEQMHWGLSQPFNSPNRAHSHLLLNSSRSGSNWQRWDQDFHLELLEESSVTQNCCQSPCFFISHGTQPGSQGSHRAVCYPYHPPDAIPGPQQREYTGYRPKGTILPRQCKWMKQNYRIYKFSN